MRSKFKWIFTLIVALTMQFSFAQEKTVKGVVTDASGAMPGVNVVVKGTQRGVSTSFDGSYAIKASEGDVLVFSFMGMNDVSRTVDASGVINVKMQDNTKVLGEVLVTGALGIKRKKDAIVSNYAVVKAEELNRAGSPNVAQALIGKVSGLQINTTSSGVDSENRVVMRGIRSMTGNNQALVVIDGAISSLATMQQIAPELIDNVNVMKGAQGAALYGSDGVNGVIVVTTKKGSSGKFAVAVRSSMDITSIAYIPERQMRYGQGWNGLHSVQENGSWGPEFDGTMYPTGMVQPDGTYVMSPYSPIKDNIKKFFTNGAIYQNSIAVSGGSLDSGYANFSANRTTNDFVVKGDELKRNSFLLKAGKKMGKFSVEGNINYITQNVKQSESGLYDALLQTATNIPVERFEYSGNGSHWTTYYNNPYWLRDNRREDLRQEKIAAIVTLGYEFNKHINVSYLGNLRLDSNDDLYFRNKWVDTSSAIWGARDHSVVAELTSVTDLRRRIYGDLLVNFDYMLTKDLSFKATLGNNIQENKFKTNAAGGQNFAVDGVYNASNVLNPYTSTSTTLEGNSLRALNTTSLNRKIGVFANLDFAYGEYLFLNATARNDWSSVFAKGNNSFFYPSVGMAFVPTKAFEGLKNNVLNYVKLSANYTKVGNDSAVGAYAINQTGALGIGYPFGSNSYVQQTAPTVPGISPEFVTTKEATVNLGFFGDRLTLDGSYYVTDTADLISQASTSAASGLSRVTANLGSLQTKGFEIDLGFTPIKSKEARGFRWDNKLNYSHYKSIITKIATGANELSLRQPYSFIGIFAEVGEEFPLIKGTTYLRDDQGRVIVDASGMPSVDPTFKKLGKATPDYILGYNTSFSYRGIKLSATMDYRTGHQFYSDVKRNLAWTGQLVESAENRGGFILPNSTYDYNGDGIYQANENNTNVVTGGTGVGSVISYYDTYASTGENLVIDATAFKLREASLSYSFPESLISKTRLSSLVIGVNARNPLSLFSKENRNYNDPETSENTGNAAGIAFTDRYPTQSSYGFSLNLTF